MGTRNFFVIVRANMPYPKEFEVVVKAHDYGTAVNRAWRKVRSEHLKGRRLTQLTFIVSNLGKDDDTGIHKESL